MQTSHALLLPFFSCIIRLLVTAGYSPSDIYLLQSTSDPAPFKPTSYR